jgi:sn-glycerol 3-phosphate transport system permease protein
MIVSRRQIWTSRIVLSVTTLLVLLPIIYQLGISLKPAQSIFGNPLPPFIFPLDFSHYLNVFQSFEIWRYFVTTLLFAGGVTLGQILLAVPAAFAFSFYEFPLRDLLLGFVLISLMVPFVVTYIPNYLLLARWKLLNTIPGMILPMLGVSLGFGIFLLRQNFMSFNRAIIEAAMIDGANSFQILTRVLAPANLSSIFAIAVYVLINTWNQFIWPLLVGGGKPESYTLTVAVQIFFTNVEAGDSWGPLMAASMLSSLPTIVIYLLMRKGILRTFTEGAVKG